MTQPTMRSAIQMLLIATALVAAWSDQGRAQQQDAKPAYCTGAGAYRLPECGLTEKEALEAEAAAALSRGQKRQHAARPRNSGGFSMVLQGISGGVRGVAHRNVIYAGNIEARLHRRRGVAK